MRARNWTRQNGRTSPPSRWGTRRKRSQYAREKRCDQIYIGTRGLGPITGMLLGSVTTKVLHLSDVPVLLVK
ncbi:MAG TPA: universal stress protein [Burkholderiales bacterium]